MFYRRAAEGNPLDLNNLPGDQDHNTSCRDHGKQLLDDTSSSAAGTYNTFAYSIALYKSCVKKKFIYYCYILLSRFQFKFISKLVHV